MQTLAEAAQGCSREIAESHSLAVDCCDRRRIRAASFLRFEISDVKRRRGHLPRAGVQLAGPRHLRVDGRRSAYSS